MKRLSEKAQWEDSERPVKGSEKAQWEASGEKATPRLISVAALILTLPAGLACDRQKRARSGDAALKERINPV